MANAVAVVTLTAGATGLKSSDMSQNNQSLYGTLAVTATPALYTTGGIVCSFQGFDGVRSDYAPLEVRAWSEPAAGAPSGYVYQFLRGTTLGNGRLAIMQSAGSAAPLVEITDGAAIPAGVSGDTIRFRAVFQRI